MLFKNLQQSSWIGQNVKKSSQVENILDQIAVSTQNQDMRLKNV